MRLYEMYMRFYVSLCIFMHVCAYVCVCFRCLTAAVCCSHSFGLPYVLLLHIYAKRFVAISIVVVSVAVS